jgi:putative transcriptional regulator
MSRNASLANHFLVAMPSQKDPDFKHVVIYLCEHHVQGTVGLIINRPMEYPLQLVFDQLKIAPLLPEKSQQPLLFGGPVQPERGFVIHRPMGEWRSSLILRDDVTVTTSNDIIRAIAVNKGPKDVLVALGYSGWTEAQFDKELKDNIWLVCPFRSEILYEVPFAERWEYAGHILGVKMNELSIYTGHA